MALFRIRILVLIVWMTGACGWMLPAVAQTPTSRIALVIGNGAYPAGAAATAPNDAGLVAQTLTAAGFDVTGARDLDGDAIRAAFRDFLAKAGQLGPDGIVFVYLAGYGLQYQGDNYYVPVDATLARDTDIPLQGIRVSDLTRALSGLPLKARVTVLDAAYKAPFPAASALAGGLALVEPEPGSLLAFNAAPGTLGPATTNAYGVYAQSSAEMMRQGGIPVQEVFDRIRLRVNEQTQGADVPWDASRLTQSFVFLELAPDAPAPATPPATYATLERRPIRDFPVDEAYNAAIARDTFQGYEEFCRAFPDSRYVRRVRALLAARREALTWSRTVASGTTAAYWSYLRRYPRGPHAAGAQRQLQALAAALTPPPEFAPIDYDVPPPPPDEIPIVDAPVIVFDEPDYGPPPPPPPVYFLPPPVAETIYDLPPPPPPAGPGFLPIPIPIPIPYARPIGQPGRLDPAQGVGGSYAQPQPYAQGSSGGLVAQPAPGGTGAPPPLRPGQRPGAPAAQPRPGLAPQPVPPGTAPRPLPGQAGQPLPTVQRPGQPAVLQPRPEAAPQPGTPGAVPRPLPGQAGQPLPTVQRPGQPANPQPRPDAAPRPGAPGGPPRPLPGQPLPTPAAPGGVQHEPDQRQRQDLHPQEQLPKQPMQRPNVREQRQQQQQDDRLRQQQDKARQQQDEQLRLQQHQRDDQTRQQQMQQRQREEQGRQQQMQQQRQQEERAHQQQIQQQRQQQDQARQQQMQQQRQREEQGRQQQMQQQRQQEERAHQQQMQQQRQQQEQARQQQMQQQRQQQEQARQQQMQQQRQQQEQARQQQMQQQRQQEERARQQQIQQQRQQARPPEPQHGPPGRPECGHPGQPPCR